MSIFKIKERLAVEVSIFRDLLEVVEEEKRTLLSREGHEELVPLAERKLQLCQELGEAQEVRRRLMRSLFPGQFEQPKLSGLIPLAPPSERPAIKEAIRGLTAMADRLKAMNQANKTYLEEALDTVEHIMAILTGQNQKSSYGPLGVQVSQTLPRLLAREV